MHIYTHTHTINYNISNDNNTNMLTKRTFTIKSKTPIKTYNCL